MREIRNRFSVVLRTSEGHQFRGEFGDPGSYPRPRKEIQNLPHRALTCDRLAIAAAGDLVSHQGVRFLLVGQNTLQHVKRFLAVEINHEASWSRLIPLIDPVTRQAGPIVPTIIDEELPVVMEPRSEIEERDFAQSHYRLLTAAPVQLGDIIDDRKVINISVLMGVNMVETA